MSRLKRDKGVVCWPLFGLRVACQAPRVRIGCASTWGVESASCSEIFAQRMALCAPYTKDDIMLVSPAFAQAAGGAGGNPIMQFVPLIAIFAIMYFLMIRPQQKKAKEHKAMIEAVRRGDMVVTAGGLMGKVTKVKEDGELEVEISEGVKVRVPNGTLANVVSKTEPAS